MSTVQSYTAEVQYDAETDDYYIQFTDEMLAITGWQIGEELTWTQLDDQTWQLSKTSKTLQSPPVV
jgi:FlaG/FlaF family flagellin (archaellin)